jgi:hypothetical protein
VLSGGFTGALKYGALKYTVGVGKNANNHKFGRTLTGPVTLPFEPVKTQPPDAAAAKGNVFMEKKLTPNYLSGQSLP